MANRFDVVAVGVEDEGAVVAGVVWALARRPVVAVAGGQSYPVELVHRRIVRSGDSDVEILGWLTRREPETAPAASEPDPILDLRPDTLAERIQHRLVEGSRGREIAHSDKDVVDHPAVGLETVLDRLDVVAGRVEDERAVVSLVVAGTEPGSAVVAEPDLGSGAPERVHLPVRRS